MGPALRARARQAALHPPLALPPRGALGPGTAGLRMVERAPVQGHHPGELRLFVGPVQMANSVPGELLGQGNALGVIETITRYLADTIVLVEF